MKVWFDEVLRQTHCGVNKATSNFHLKDLQPGMCTLHMCDLH